MQGKMPQGAKTSQGGKISQGSKTSQGGKTLQGGKTPQGGRKVAFSGKQKKQQLQKKKEKKRGGNEAEDSTAPNTENVACAEKVEVKKKTELKNLSPQCSYEHTRNLNRYKIHFKKVTEEELQKRKENARMPIQSLPEKALEINFEDIYGQQEIDIPKRPEWSYILSKYELEAKEQRSFREYIEEIEFKYKDQYVSYFEMNLETWRQLWRVLEMSDIILIIADIRHPIIHFPPSLYRHVTEDLKRDVILVLNKIDLAPASLVVAWLHYFQNLFPKLHIMCYAAYAGAAAVTGRKGRRKGKLRMATNGAKELLKICEKIIQGSVNLSDWHKKIQEEETQASGDHLQVGDENHDSIANVPLSTVHAEGPQGDDHKEGMLTIGCVGHPNVGKSSLLNAVIGKKVVSVSRTPGHTKHFQTIFLTPTVRLCDCPGLVFPSMIPKSLQVLSGCYPISQLREPYTSIKYLAERLSLPKLLKLQHPENESSWSAYDICEAWAKKRGFITARAARLDTYRAANDILRMALDGRTICLTFYPPGYLEEKETRWLAHPSVTKIEGIQGVKKLMPSIGEFEYGDVDTDYSTENEDDNQELDKREYEDEHCSSPGKNRNRFGLLLA